MHAARPTADPELAASPERRWAEAQTAEREFWTGVPTHPATVAAIVGSLTEVARWAAGRVPVDPRVPWVEIGVGPLGLGVSHFLRAAPGHPPIVGIDPIPLDTRSAADLPDPLGSLVESCRRGYEHVEARGEATGLESARFGAAFLNNMLDHVAVPADVMRETRRLLAPGGHLILTCDVFSAAGRLKHDVWNRRRHPDSILVRAHPHRFSHDDLRALVKRTGFTIVAASDESTRMRRVAGAVSEVTIHATAR